MIGEKMILGLNHVKLEVSNLAVSKAFYCDLLGFKYGPEFRNADGKVTGCYLYIGRDTFVELFESTEPVVPFSHFCLEVTDLPNLLTKIKDAGIKTTDIFLGTSKAWIASIWDPDGHHIELNEYSHPDSWIANYLSKVECK